MNSENVKKKKKKRRKKKEKDSYKTRESQSFIFYWYEIGTCSIMDNISCLNSNARTNLNAMQLVTMTEEELLARNRGTGGFIYLIIIGYCRSRMIYGNKRKCPT